MSIVIKLSPSFYEHVGNRETIEVTGRTIKESLDSLMELYPIFKELLFNDKHYLSALIICQGETIVQNQLDRQVEDHQEILILPMVYGG